MLRQGKFAKNSNTCVGQGAAQSSLQLNLPIEHGNMSLDFSRDNPNFNDPQQSIDIASIPPDIILEYSSIYYRRHGRYFIIHMEQNSKIDPSLQYSINFMTEEKVKEYPGRRVSNVINFVDAYDRQGLDVNVVDLFKDIPELRKPALRLQGKGIGLVGSLVQMKKSRLLDYPFITEEILSIMESRLNKFGFKFEMNLPWWSRTRESLKQQALFRG